MKKSIKCICLFIISFLIIKISVNAECTYQERKDLLNAAKNVDIIIEPFISTHEEKGYSDFSEEEETFYIEDYSFLFTISNLPESLYIEYYSNTDNDVTHIDSDDLVSGLYVFEDTNYEDIKTYYFEIRSNNKNCLGNSVYTKKVIKPKFNNFSDYSICDDSSLLENEICKKFITKELNLTEADFYKKASTIKEKSQQNARTKKGFIDYLEEYWYIGVLLVIMILGIIIFTKVRKKRAEL